MAAIEVLEAESAKIDWVGLGAKKAPSFDLPTWNVERTQCTITFSPDFSGEKWWEPTELVKARLEQALKTAGVDPKVKLVVVHVTEKHTIVLGPGRASHYFHNDC